MSDPVSTEAQREPYPRPEEINDLPEHIRWYIHDLETRCDPAGDLRRLDAEKQKRRELEAENEQLRRALREIQLQADPASIPVDTLSAAIASHFFSIRQKVKDALSGGGEANG